ncbi:MAG: hypothetical protein ABH821_03730 [archaeon]
MYAFLSKLLVTGKLKFKEGSIVAFDEPFALVPMTSIKSMTDDAIQEGKKGINDLYFYGWVFGYIVTKKLINTYHLKKFEERYKISMDIASLTGFGDYKTSEFERGKFSHFKIFKNPFALEYYPSKTFVDHYLRGMNAGGGSLVHETLMDCVEFECTAVNGKFCRHRNLDQEGLDKVDKKLISEQLDREYLRKRQIGLIESCGDNAKDFL